MGRLTSLSTMLGDIDLTEETEIPAEEPKDVVPEAQTPVAVPQPVEPAAQPAVARPRRTAKPRVAAKPAEPIEPTGPAYLEFIRKESRLRADQLAALHTRTIQLNTRKNPDTPRITDNTLIRVAVDLLLARADELAGSDEAALRRSVGLGE